MPTSTADTVAYACWPASSGPLTVTRIGYSGRICSGALSPTATRRALRSIGTHATQTARAGVILLGALPPRQTRAETTTAWRAHASAHGITEAWTTAWQTKTVQDTRQQKRV